LLYTADEGAVSINVIIETGQQLFFHAINWYKSHALYM
jgi:hypothetical protein